MDFFNKVKDTVASVTTEAGQKVSYSTEKTKINSQIRANEKEIKRITDQIGAKCVELHLMDENTEYEEFFSQIRNYQEKNKECEMEIVRLGEEYEEKQRLRQQEMASEEHGIKCPSCGCMNEEDSKFCVGCGSKIEIVQEETVPAEEKVEAEVQVKAEEQVEEQVQVEEQKTCVSCGHVIADGELFCIQCGTKVED